MNRVASTRPGGVEGVAMVLTGRPLEGSSPWRLLAPFSIEAPHVLAGVAASSADDVWAVGQAQGRPLATHWNGTSWSTPPSPPPSAPLVGAGLESVAVGPGSETGPGGPTGVAVGGAYDRLLGAEVPLIRHWDGERWIDHPAPVLPGDQAYVLTGVTIVDAGTAWAVGHGFGGRNTLIALSWRDGRWHPAGGLPETSQGKLLAVSGTSPQDVWAVGAAGRNGLIVHYDGNSWRHVPSPSTRFPLTDVTAVSPDEVWCVGGTSVLRWNGRKWSRVKAPIESANTVTAISPTDVWIGGAQGDLVHYDGRRWTRTAAPGDLGDTAVWRASTATAGAPEDALVWMVGSRRRTEAVTAAHHGSISAQSGEP